MPECENIKRGEPECEDCQKKRKCKCPKGYHDMFKNCRGY